MGVIGVSTPARVADVAFLVVLALCLRRAAARLTGPRVQRPWTPRRRPSRDASPDDLAVVDRAVRTASSSARTYHFGLRRTLQRIVAPHVVGADGPEHAPEIRRLLADVREPDDAREQGPPIDELERLVTAVERVVEP